MIHRGAEKTSLFSGAAALGVELDDRTADRLLDYLDLLYAWNRSAGLTTVRREDAVRLHLLDSLTVLWMLDGVERLADLGTGGGLPGIPIAAVLPDVEVSLVESRRRKCSFLSEARRVLELDNCSVLETDADALVESHEPFDAVVSRAFRPPLQAAAAAARSVRSGGRVILMAGRGAEAGLDSADLARLGLAPMAGRELQLPGGPERRHVIALLRS